TEVRRERRLEARLSLLAFNGFEQRGLFATDVGAGAEMRIEIEIDTAALHVLAEQARVVGVLQRGFETFVRLPEFAADIVVTNRRADAVTSDRHAFDERVRVVAQDVAVLAGARLAFVRV